MQQSRTAVIADDDKETLRDLVRILESENFNVALALDTQHAIQLINRHQPLLIISEIANQNYDGIGLFNYLKNDATIKEVEPRIIALTSNSEEQYEILSYESGIDFFLRKPLRKNAFRKRLTKFFGEEENVFHLKPIDEYEIRDLYFDIKKHLLFKLPSKDLMQIQSKSFEILLFLARFPNKVFSREQIMQAIWGNSSKVTLRSVDIHILKIRQLLGEDYIKTIKGVGYLFKDQK
ncbi:DNA-binding response regulator [Marivirga tractuosa]|uniref:Two component transcriptional regulator, winged helix family n=1 Tax=Marivirga tractuosa (strain ATCC 23168 / DSM 4126 / NBRC 15989 / NCIMB 1408 / VKM B-1430 / H-43) TaxID=643867 RepID=E4TMP6_MARTH|nr:response regulator transcription factor [Marivirga tractuosa]ADR20344.1 two component transcriptional regulator, winged helix family [Marivirga tractuosa DSM 4126]BDD15214.1 DNA-binding response regulator [Marivirga tractuosa]